jgi:1-acyl-sn-glycerol-3-phosphate acyltransferase
VFYSLLKFYARFAIRIYCRKIVINKPEILQMKGPLLLAANHPNSFLDGIILTTLFDQPVYSLARGDAFKNKTLDTILRRLKLLPVYRTSEGVGNLGENYTTFAACRKAFEDGSIVLIFSEGKCENEWHLRPLRKGTARLAITSWQQGIPLKVIPTAFNYSSFRNFGKEVHMYFGETMDRVAVQNEPTKGKQLLAFNEQLNQQLQKMVYEIDPADVNTIKEKFDIKITPAFYFLLLPAIAGWILHAPLFYPLRAFTKFRFESSDHYDSVLNSLLLLSYPFYLVLLFFIFYSIAPLAGIAMFFVLPFSAWCLVQFKYQIGI